MFGLKFQTIRNFGLDLTQTNLVGKNKIKSDLQNQNRFKKYKKKEERYQLKNDKSRKRHNTKNDHLFENNMETTPTKKRQNHKIDSIMNNY